ncbi:MAG: D-aminoacyl-tRNA deacylase [Firmicutes bacterium]|jgi:D-tyrosyl-tRNA(Tyr) deacylase|nr:D-aminoacyl-tRNA deacylase [Bacillota bacterium]MDH7495583.1 D-aminoacyl-tRNA deacylase [Bacillota bacterium]
MRAVVQRAKSARVVVGDEVVGRIGRGVVVFLGVGADDSQEDARYLAEKVAGLRILDDEAGKMNLSCLDLGLPVLAVSQFTLYGDCRRGRRPSFTEAARPEKGLELYGTFVTELRRTGLVVETGRFQAAMTVFVENDGPVTILLDSRKLF